MKNKSSLATKLLQKIVLGGHIVAPDKDGGCWIYREELLEGKVFPFYEKLDSLGNRVDMTFELDKVNNAK